MAEEFLSLSREDRQEALQIAAEASARPVHILEKDVWVVWTLRSLFNSDFGQHLVFKGGTSLSKAYNVIRRFSEDIDVTYNIQAFAPDIVPNIGQEAVPPNNSQQARWSSAIRERLPEWVLKTAAPVVEAALSNEKVVAKARAEGVSLYIEYEPHAPGYAYVKPQVQVEFGASSTGEPAAVHEITCDAALHVPTILFPTANPRVMLAERTFWEKATAIHVFCRQLDSIKERLARLV